MTGGRYQKRHWQLWGNWQRRQGIRRLSDGFTCMENSHGRESPERLLLCFIQFNMGKSWISLPAVYQERSFGKQTQELLEKARHRKKELEEMGKKVELLKEEPFLYAKDSVEYKLHLMIWKEEGRDRKVEIETIEE